MKEEPSDHVMDVTKDVIVEGEEDVDNMFTIMTEKPTNKKKVKVTAIHLSHSISLPSSIIGVEQSAAKPLITTTTLNSIADSEGCYQICK